MMFFYYPAILISTLGYGFFTCRKLIKLNTNNLGYHGIVGIFFLLIISYISSQFLAHNFTFNSIILIIGIILFLFNFKEFMIKINDIRLLLLLLILSLIFILVGKNHDDFFYYHFPYMVMLTEYPHPIGLGNLNHGFKTHSSIFLLSSLFHLPGAKYSLFHLGPAYIMIFSNFILLKIILKKEIVKNNIFITFLSLASFIFINIFFYRLGEHGTDRSAMILIILLFVNLILFINKNSSSVDNNLLKFLTIIFTIVVSLKAFYLIYSLLFLPLIFYVYKKKSIKLFFNFNLFLCLVLFTLVIVTNFFNTGCLIFPEKKTCFVNLSWSLPLETVEYLRLHYENWAKAGSGSGYVNLMDKNEYVKNFNWFNNWVDRYFFNKVSDFFLSLLLIVIIFLSLFKKSKLHKTKKRNFLLLYPIIVFITFVWFMLHPTLRYGGYHLFFLIIFMPLSIYLEKFSQDIANLDKKILILVLITALVFVGRNVSRLTKEKKIYSYNINNKITYPIEDDSFEIQKRFSKIIINTNYCKQKSNKCDEKMYKVKEVFKNKYVIYRMK